MAKIEFPIADGFYEDGSLPIASQECVNLIPSVPQANALSQAQLIGTPGISEFADTGVNAARGEHVMGGIPYSVNGDTLYRTNSDGTDTSLGTISGQGSVSIADNGVQMCIVVPGSTGYIYTVAGGLVTISDADFTTTLGPSQQVVFLDSYFVHFNNNSSASSFPIFFISNLNDGTAYDALDFSTAEADPDEITGLHVNRNQLFVGGDQTIEPFANVGGAGFPFQRIPGGLIQKGVKAKFSLKDFDNSFVFLGGGVNESPAIWKYTGSSAVKISTAAIDHVIQDSTDSELEDVFTTVYAARGGFFVNFHLKDRVFTYDATASALKGRPTWHERRSRDSEDREVIWRVNGIMTAYGSVLVTDNQSGKIGKLDHDVYAEYGTSVNRRFSTIPFTNQGNSLEIGEVEVTCESGTALTAIPKYLFPLTFPIIFGGLIDGAEPKLVRSFSDDGGFTFSNETSRSLGLQGERKKRQIWRREGQVQRFRVYKFSVSDPIKVAIIKFEADVLGGAA